MTDDSAAPDSARSNLLFFCGAPIAAVLLMGGIAGSIAYFSGPSKGDAREACAEVAVLRGDGSEFTDVDVKHVDGNVYKVTGTVVTPGLPDEDFKGYADIEDGEYICEIAD